MYDISGFASSNTRIRFRVNELYGGSNEDFLVDNVEIRIPVALVSVPDVEGSSLTTAQQAIVAANLTVGNVTLANSDTVPVGNVISQDPVGGSSVVEGTPVNLVASLGSAGTTETVRDEFNAVAYNNNDGTLNWAGDWIENDPDGAGPNDGNVLITNGELSLDDRPNTGSEPSLEREANLQGTTSAIFTFDFRTTGDVDPNDSVEVEVSSDGGATWTVLENFTGISGATAGSRVYDISGFASSNTRIRFRVNELYGGSNEDFLVDNVEIRFSIAAVSVPDVVGLPQTDAEAAIVAANLIVGAVTTANSDTVPVDSVISQDPVGGSSVVEGTPVDLAVSLGPVVVSVPDVVGLPQADAEAAIVAANLVVGVVTTAGSDTVPAGSVISQDPTGGSSAVEGSAVDLVVSAGPVVVSVPDVVGLPQADAEAAIVAANLVVGVVTTAGSDTVPAGSVISQDPVGGSSVAEGSAVDLVVSLGPVVVSVPDVVGLPQADAEAAIVAANLVVGVVTTAGSDTVPAGSVISQDPVGGSSVAEGSAVDLVVSLGPVVVSVPDVVGLPQADAEAAIVAANLVVGVVTTAGSDTLPAGNVISQDPTGGSSVAEGSAVDLIVSLGPVVVTAPDVVGLPQADAEAAIVAANLVVGAVTTANSDTVPAGSVISQDPVGGSSEAEGSAVDLVVSAGPVVVTVPEVVGLPQADAEAAIVAASLVVGNVTTANSNTVPAGSVISQDPAGGNSVPEGSAVDLVVSLGPVLVSVPDVTGLLQADAEAAIVAANLTVGNVSTANSDTVPAGSVISQDPIGGSSVVEGSPVDLVVSLGSPFAIDLGEAGSYTVLGLTDVKIIIDDRDTGVVGDVGLGPNGDQDLKDGFIAGTLFIDPSAENANPDTDVQGGIVVQDLAPAVADALQASSDAADLAPTQTFGEIKEPQTIESDGQLTVIAVDKIDLNDGEVLTLRGGPDDQFVVNISDSLKVDNNSGIQLDGLQASNVLFNLTKQDGIGEIKKGSSASGIFLAAGNDTVFKIEDFDTVVEGTVIAAKEISLKKDAQVVYFGEQPVIFGDDDDDDD